MGKIPNIIHFICISPMVFKIYHYIAISSAMIHNPDIIYIYVDKEPENNIYWEDIKKNKKVIVEKITPSDIFRGVKILHPQYQADIIRLEKLIQRGGMYLDIDNMSLKSMQDLFDNDLVIGATFTDQNNEENGGIDAMSNSIILARKNHPFLIEWYNNIHKYIYNGNPWAYHAVCLPRDILIKDKNLMDQVTLLDWHKKLCPRGLWKELPYIFNENENDRISDLDGFYTLVFYQTLFRDKYLIDITLDSVINNNDIFSKLFKKYVMHLKN